MTNRSFKAGSTVPVIFRLRNATGEPIAPSEAQALTDDCAVRIDFTAESPDPGCVRYDAENDQFVFQLRTPRDGEGIHTITVVVVIDGVVVTTGSIDITLR